MNKILLGTTIITSTILVGCGSTTVEMTDYKEVSMQTADILPTKESLSGEKQKIVIFPADTSNSPLAKESHSGTTMATTLETYLAEVGVEIVDRNIAKKLKKELQLAESKGKSNYDGPDIANYAITASISNASFTYSFKKRSSWTSKKTGKTYVTPAYCKFKSRVSANLKLYKLPGLSYSKTITTDGSASLKSEMSNSKCPISEDSAYSLVRKATQRSIKNNQIKFQNYFSPKAYVLARKVNSGSSLFKISAGKNFGFVPESTITFYNLNVVKNPLTGDVKAEEYSVVEGTVTANLIGDDFAWILVDDEKADNIKLGDYVKVKYEDSMLKSSIDSINNLLK